MDYGHGASATDRPKATALCAGRNKHLIELHDKSLTRLVLFTHPTVPRFIDRITSSPAVSN
jgi:hypothetical protein